VTALPHGGAARPCPRRCLAEVRERSLCYSAPHSDGHLPSCVVDSCPLTVTGGGHIPSGRAGRRARPQSHRVRYARTYHGSRNSRGQALHNIQANRGAVPPPRVPGQRTSALAIRLRAINARIARSGLMPIPGHPRPSPHGTQVAVMATTRKLSALLAHPRHTRRAWPSPLLTPVIHAPARSPGLSAPPRYDIGSRIPATPPAIPSAGTPPPPRPYPPPDICPRRPGSPYPHPIATRPPPSCPYPSHPLPGARTAFRPVRARVPGPAAPALVTPSRPHARLRDGLQRPPTLPRIWPPSPRHTHPRRLATRACQLVGNHDGGIPPHACSRRRASARTSEAVPCRRYVIPLGSVLLPPGRAVTPARVARPGHDGGP